MKLTELSELSACMESGFESFPQCATAPIAITESGISGASPTAIKVPQSGLSNLSQPELKELFQGYALAHHSTSAMLPDIVGELIRLGVQRPTLVRWAIEEGCAESYARSLVSRILTQLGQRELE